MGIIEACVLLTKRLSCWVRILTNCATFRIAPIRRQTTQKETSQYTYQYTYQQKSEVESYTKRKERICGEHTHAHKHTHTHACTHTYAHARSATHTHCQQHTHALSQHAAARDVITGCAYSQSAPRQEMVQNTYLKVSIDAAR